MTHWWTVSRTAWTWSTRVYPVGPGQGSKFKRHLRWAATAAIRQGDSDAWFRLLESPEMVPFLRANPRLVFRPMGTYMSLKWDWARRIKVIGDTYGFISALGGSLAEAMVRPGGMVLARLPLAQGDEAILRLGFGSKFRKEGEVAVSLELARFPGEISEFAFSLEHHPDQGLILHVGAVQGRKGGGEDVVKAATKALHGLRPKQMMVLVAQEIARSLRVAELRGVGNGIHVFRSRTFKSVLTGRYVTFDYDDLWTEAQGVRRPDGWFSVPLRTPRRTAEEIKPNKRGMYARRYALMDDLSRQIRIQLTPFPRR